MDLHCDKNNNNPESDRQSGNNNLNGNNDNIIAKATKKTMNKILKIIIQVICLS